jgi:hypothetical protein
MSLPRCRAPTVSRSRLRSARPPERGSTGPRAPSPRRLRLPAPPRGHPPNRPPRTPARKNRAPMPRAELPVHPEEMLPTITLRMRPAPAGEIDIDDISEFARVEPARNCSRVTGLEPVTSACRGRTGRTTEVSRHFGKSFFAMNLGGLGVCVPNPESRRCAAEVCAKCAVSPRCVVT